MAKGLKFLDKVHNPITVFGSARTKEENGLYEDVMDLCHKLSDKGYSIITGGGPGLMAAANEGCQMGSSDSIGISLSNLPCEKGSPFLDREFHTDYFFVRKVLMTRKTEAFVICPGGFGTFDELFEIVTLMQTHKIDHKPIILYDSNFWCPIMGLIMNKVLQYGTADESIFSFVHYADNADQINFILDKHKLDDAMEEVKYV